MPDLKSISHVPKRAVGHGCYVSTMEAQRPSMKPGQTLQAYHRRNVYTTVVNSLGFQTSDLPHQQFANASTVYKKDICSNTQPYDYKRPLLTTRAPVIPSSGWGSPRRTFKDLEEKRKTLQSEKGPRNPASILYPVTDYSGSTAFVGADRWGMSVNRDVMEVSDETKQATAAWISQQKADTGPETYATHRAFKQGRHPPFQMPPPPTCLQQPIGISRYTTDFGAPGTNPRFLVPPGATRIPVPKDELYKGTTKGSFHTPNYGGFLPVNLKNTGVARHAEGAATRSVDKTNITDIYRHNLPGYGGHVPTNAVNDRGPRILGDRSSTGRMLLEPYTITSISK
uniref:Uncharacterized protein n=1 Tax=Chromera velia CCMP2878 TaxID=1169474 RepID=A0A0G4G3C2_9ALVE|eukprot:Cvel_20029.t1-p1 / transcript=Cvel_20029.t1 / gene=Cvel_20029 / organism=Chromera_velia_CCMP2878 / gene_product=hypothetical protein / transcript_product=hypothetical protein / location=Cvel_scaffold1768:34188-35204(-) / protein_length=339 / sequence_SO=supercontig / SO=protein_coding / is_pseudo=false